MYFKLLRVKQWIKNLFVFFVIFFNNSIFEVAKLSTVIQIFFIMCLASSFIYILNDIVDVEKDKLHYKKKERPIASGKIKKANAIILAFFLVGIAIFWSLMINIYTFSVVIAYVTLNILYCFLLKKIVIIDVMCIAVGHVLRILIGGISINIELSPWIILCTFFLSLFFGFNKRKSEFVTINGEREKQRDTLEAYNVEYTNFLISSVTTATIMCYSMYAMFSEYSNMIYTIPFVLYGIYRYEYILYNKYKDESTENIVLKDLPIIIDVILWLIVSFLLVYIF